MYASHRCCARRKGPLTDFVLVPDLPTTTRRRIQKRRVYVYTHAVVNVELIPCRTQGWLQREGSDAWDDFPAPIWHGKNSRSFGPRRRRVVVSSRRRVVESAGVASCRVCDGRLAGVRGVSG